MAFTSLNFWLLFPFMFAIFWLIPYRQTTLRNIYLLFLGYVLYALWKPVFLIVLILVTLFTYFGALSIEKKGDRKQQKQKMILFLLLSLLPLMIFKYYNFLNDNISVLFDSLGVRIVLPGLNWAIPVGLSFYTFQSLFWDELFVLNSKGETPGSDSYSLKSDAGDVKLVNSQNEKVALTFILNAANQLVSETVFSRAYSYDPVVKWQYSEWTKVGEKDFPGTMKVSFDINNDNVEALFRISSVKPDSSWETRTEVNKNRYSEISLEAAFRKIMSMAQ